MLRRTVRNWLLKTKLIALLKRSRVYQSSESTTKLSKAEQRKRTKWYEENRPFHGDNLIKAIEYEQGLRDHPDLELATEKVTNSVHQ